VANVFISHAGADVGWADEIHQWLAEDRHKIFLDSNIDDGVAAGEEWRPRLYERLRWADAVICVVTPAYLASPWCAAEIGAAQALGSEILPVRASSEPLDNGLLTTKQFVDVVRDASSARDRLRLRLSIIDGTGGRRWPDDTSPYPGLRPFQLGEHLVFFGRGREIKEITERLRSPAERSERTVLTMVGPSGCGKSSLVRAGVLPRIAGGDEWLTVPPIVPGSDPTGNLVRAIASLVRERHIDFDLTSLRMNLGQSGLKAVATDLLVAARADNQCKLLIVIDQFEELLTQTESRDRAAFVETIQSALGGPVQALATMRPEFLDPASKDPDLLKLPPRIQPLRPLAADALREVIERPAGVAGLTFDDDLVTRLVTDTGSGDALPLLAFTLEQLADGVRRGGRLTHQRYDEIGGVRGALQRQADAALEEACNKAGSTRAQVISALLDLATIDANGRPTKRRAVVDELSRTLIDELKPFVDRRLLSTGADGERTVVGVAHEAFLDSWPPLKDEIETQVAALRARRVVESAANDWVASGRDERSLLQGGQLTKATVDTGAVLKPIGKPDANSSSGRNRFPGLRMLRRSRRRLVTRVDLDEIGEQFLEASIRADRARRRRRIVQVAAVIAILCVVAGTAVAGFLQARNERDKAQDNARKATAAQLAAEAEAVLTGAHTREDIRTIQQTLAAESLSGSTDPGVLIPTLNALSATVKVIDTGGQVWSLSYRADGHRIVTGGDQAREWDADTGQLVGTPITPADVGGYNASFNPSNDVIATLGKDRSVRLWKTDTHEPIGDPITLQQGIIGFKFNHAGDRIAALTADGQIQVLNTATRDKVGPSLRPKPGIKDFAFSPTNPSVLIEAGETPDEKDGYIRYWNLTTGLPDGESIGGGTVFDVAFSPDGRQLVTGSLGTDLPNTEGDSKYNSPMQRWDTASRAPLGDPMRGHIGVVRSVAYSPDGRYIASVAVDRTLRIWDANTGSLVGEPLRGHGHEITDVAFSPVAAQLATGSIDGTLRVWRIPMPRPSVARPIFGELAPGTPNDPPVSPPTSIAAGLDSHHVVIETRRGDVSIYDPEIGKADGPPIPGDPSGVSGLAFSPDERRIAVGSWNGTVRLWAAQNRTPIGGAKTPHESRVIALRFSRDSHRLLSRSEHIMQVWDSDSGLPIGRPMTDCRSLDEDSFAFSPNGHLVAAGCEDDKTVRLWNADTGDPIGKPMQGHKYGPTNVSFTPDGTQIVSVSVESLRLWRTDTQLSTASRSSESDDPFIGLAIREDGKYIVTGGLKSLHRWDGRTGDPIGTPMTGLQWGNFGVAFTRSGRYIVSLDNDSLRFWDVETGASVGEPLKAPSKGGGMRTWVKVVVSGDDRAVYTTDDLVWPGPASWHDDLCGKVTTNMTQKQWRDWISTDPNIGYRKLCEGLPTPRN
jgi:WD40 repeat protein